MERRKRRRNEPHPLATNAKLRTKEAGADRRRKARSEQEKNARITLQLSTELDKKHKSKIDKLSKVSGADFDRQYMQDMISDHKDDVKKFQRQSDKGKDPDLQKFASQTLPTLKEHLQLAESTGQEIKTSGKSAKKLQDK